MGKRLNHPRIVSQIYIYKSARRNLFYTIRSPRISTTLYLYKNPRFPSPRGCRIYHLACGSLHLECTVRTLMRVEGGSSRVCVCGNQRVNDDVHVTTHKTRLRLHLWLIAAPVRNNKRNNRVIKLIECAVRLGWWKPPLSCLSLSFSGSVSLDPKRPTHPLCIYEWLAPLYRYFFRNKTLHRVFTHIVWDVNES